MLSLSLVEAVKASPEEPYFLVNLVTAYQKAGKGR